MPDRSNMTPEQIHRFMKAAEIRHKKLETEIRATHPEWTEEQIAEAMRGAIVY